MTASKPKTPTASGISRLLAAAGFTRAVCSEKRGTTTAGFKASASTVSAKGVRVEYRALLSGQHSTRLQMLARYAETIAAAGYETRLNGPWVAVTAKTED